MSNTHKLWLKSYMNGWNQNVKCSNNRSTEAREVTVGIPQGGPLSAKLFTYVTDDINNQTLQIDQQQGNMIKYSDDTRIAYIIRKNSATSDQMKYENHVNAIAVASEKKNLKLNESKCEELVCHHINIKDPEVLSICNTPLKINNNGISRVKKVKYLGLTISNNLKWTPHINNIVKKVNHIIKCLLRIIPYLSREKKLQLYSTLILPNILYASEVWGNSLTDEDKKKIKKLVSFYSKVSSIKKDILKKKLNEQYESRFIAYIDKVTNNKNHPLHYDLMMQQNSTRKTRNIWKEIYCRTTTYQNSFLPKAISYLCKNNINIMLID